MTTIEYSVAARNAKAAFLGVDYIVYVEGPDDVPFWEELFVRFSDLQVSIEAVGGATELQKYVQEIEGGLLNAVAACDRDYGALQECLSDSPRILYTYGHSIENSLYIPEVVLGAIRHIGRLNSRDVDAEEYERWVANFAQSVDELLTRDVAVCILGAGETVLGLNCTRFMTTATSHLVDSAKVAEFVDGLTTAIGDDDIEDARSRIGDSQIGSFFCLGGTFFNLPYSST